MKFFRALLPCVVRRFLPLALGLAQLAADADSLTNAFLRGLVCISETSTNPPQHFFVARIDLTNPKVHLRVAPAGPGPGGSGKWETTLLEPTKIAASENFDLVVNGDFFDALGVKDGEGTNVAYRAGLPALVIGPAMTDGKTWAVTAKPRPCLVMHTNCAATIEMRQSPADGDWEVLGGNTMVLHDGAPVLHANQARHPRTAVGLDATKRTLTLLVADGRKPGIASGMSYDELAAEMLRLGCTDALNLDGGGSSVMALRDSTGCMRILNEPTDGHERPVASVLGISVDKN